MNPCGRCKGRGRVKRTIGFGEFPCPDCKGTGIKARKSSLGSRTVSIKGPHGTCRFCGKPATQFHHVVAQNRLDRFLSPDLAQKAKADRRNGIPVDWACHDLIERDPTRVTQDKLHSGFWEFVAQYDLFAALPRHLQACGAAVDIAAVGGRSTSRVPSRRWTDR